MGVLAGEGPIDYGVFVQPGFDPNDYANAVLAGDTYPANPKSKATRNMNQVAHLDSAREDISVALAKLNAGIDDVSQKLRTTVSNHHEALLTEAAGVTELDSSLQAVRRGLGELSGSLEKLRLKIRVPYQNLAALVIRLQRLQLAAGVLRRTSRFVLLARRLEFQMKELEKGTHALEPNGKAPISAPALGDEGFGPEGERERTIAKAALSVAELSSLCAPETAKVSEGGPTEVPTSIPLRSINACTRHIPNIDTARVKITEEMEIMLREGLAALNRSLLASALQTAHNLRVLPQLVQDVVDEISDYVESRVKFAFDAAQISKEVTKDAPASTAASLMYRSRVRTEPTNATAPQWANALWSRLEELTEDLSTSCIKIYTLEKVLRLKRDGASKLPFLDEALKYLDSKPSQMFWMTTARCLEAQARDASKNSTFIQQTLSNGYPRLLRLFHDFFSKIALHTDTVYMQSYQSPETVLVLRAITTFEALYLSRSSNRLAETVGTAFRGSTHQQPPGATEGVAIARTIVNELDSARFDPLLVRAVARNVVSSLDLFLTRTESLVIADRSATSLVGPSLTPQMALNASLASCLFHCWHRLSRLDGEYHESVASIIEPSIQNLKTAFEKITEPLLLAIRRDLSAIVTRLHRVDFTKPSIGGPSTYMKDLVEKLGFIRNEVLARFQVGELSRTWTASIVKRVIRSFVLHASLVKPLGESGKLQLTSDMADFEFALNAFMTENSTASATPAQKAASKSALRAAIAEDYSALRAFRPLIFLDTASLAAEERTVGCPPLIVLHHILVRSHLPLPHVTQGWKVDEYVRWVDEHSEAEAYSLVEKCLEKWEGDHDDESDSEETLATARSVLLRAVTAANHPQL